MADASESDEPEILFGIYCPPHPQPLLAPELNDGYAKLRAAFDECRKRIEESDADLILIYSTTWPSIVGHQIQALENPVWTHVDDDFHYLGSMPYDFRMDVDFANGYAAAAVKRGLQRGHSRATCPCNSGWLLQLLKAAQGLHPRAREISQHAIFAKEIPCSVEQPCVPRWAPGNLPRQQGSNEMAELMNLPVHEEPLNANRVRELRENKLMTQAQLARKAKVALRTIHSVEKGMKDRKSVV